MTDNTTTFTDGLQEEASALGERVSNSAERVQNKVSDMGRTAVNKLDENRHAAASGLQKAAVAIHDKAEMLPGGQRVSGMAHAAADKLSSTAEYVREHDVKRMMADVETLVKNNPGPALAAVAAIGFLVGRAFSNNRDY